MAKILVCTRGSWGDIFPYAALASRLAEMGHQVVLVSNQVIHKSRLNPLVEVVTFGSSPRKAEDRSKSNVYGLLTGGFMGSIRVLRRLSDGLDAEVARIKELAIDADLIVSSQTSLAAPLVARASNKPWVFSAVSPMGFFSWEDPPYFLGLRWLSADSMLPCWWRAVLRWCVKKIVDVIYIDYRRIERSMGLRHEHPLFDGRHSPYLNLAMFSPALATGASDWPKPWIQCGLVKSDSQGSPFDDFKLNQFLTQGPAPVVFTLGSVARVDPKNFFNIALEVVRRLGLRAVLVKHESVPLQIDQALPVHVCSFADYPSLFASASAVVHHGGIATLHEAMCAGIPSLIVPRTLDQFDQASRAKRLGVAEVLPFDELNAERLERLLVRLLGAHFKIPDSKAFQLVASCENGADLACMSIDNLLVRLAGSSL